jgi:O-antigen ligase
VLLGLAACLLSGSRGSWLALPCCALLAAWLLLRAGQGRLLLKLGAAGLVAIAALALLPNSPLTARARQAMTEADHYTCSANADSSVGARLEMLRVGLHLAPQHLLLGWGKEGMMQAKQQMVREGLASPSVEEHTHLHNEYLDAVVKHGLPGLLAVLALYLLPLQLFARRLCHGRQPRSPAGSSGRHDAHAQLSGLRPDPGVPDAQQWRHDAGLPDGDLVVAGAGTACEPGEHGIISFSLSA